MTAAEHHGHLWVPGAWVLRDLIEHRGHHARGEGPVRRVLRYEETTLLVLGLRTDAISLLHADVALPDGARRRILPVFTTEQRAMQATETNPAFWAFQVFEMRGRDVLRALEPGEWLVIDFCTPAEFELSPRRDDWGGVEPLPA